MLIARNAPAPASIRTSSIMIAMRILFDDDVLLSVPFIVPLYLEIGGRQVKYFRKNSNGKKKYTVGDCYEN